MDGFAAVEKKAFLSCSTSEFDSLVYTCGCLETEQGQVAMGEPSCSSFKNQKHVAKPQKREKGKLEMVWNCVVLDLCCGDWR